MNGERLNAYPLQDQEQNRCLYLLFLLGIIPEGLTTAVKQKKEKEIKDT